MRLNVIFSEFTPMGYEKYYLGNSKLAKLNYTLRLILIFYFTKLLSRAQCTTSLTIIEGRISRVEGAQKYAYIWIINREYRI